MSANQPVVDHSRRSLSVPRHLMPSLLAAHAGRMSSSSAFNELRAAGIIAARRLDPMVSELIGVVTNPTLVITVDVNLAGSLRPVLATIWQNGSAAVIGHGGEDVFQIVAVDPLLLPFHLAQLVNLVPHRQPTYSGGFTVPASTLAHADSLAAIEPRRAEETLLAAGVPPAWTERILATLIMRRALWTIESIWLGDHRRREEARLVVLDGGFSGYWRLTQQDGVVRVRPVGFDDLIQQLGDLLPRSC